MPTVAHDSEADTRRAWREYAMSTEGLEGPEYDLAEEQAWARLQEPLEERGDESPLDRPPVG